MEAQRLLGVDRMRPILLFGIELVGVEIIVASGCFKAIIPQASSKEIEGDWDLLGWGRRLRVIVDRALGTFGFS